MTSDDIKVVNTSISIPKKLYTEFKAKVKDDGLTLTDAMTSLIYNYLKKESVQ